MHFHALGLALLCLFMLKSVHGFQLGVESRELGLADVPSCGVSLNIPKPLSIPNLPTALMSDLHRASVNMPA